MAKKVSCPGCGYGVTPEERDGKLYYPSHIDPLSAIVEGVSRACVKSGQKVK